MYQRALPEGEQGLAVIAFLVLLDGILDGLAGERVLELRGGGGDAVDAEQEIDRLFVLAAEAYLAGDGEAVGCVLPGRVGIERGGGREVCEAEGLAEEIKAVAEDVQGSLGVQGFGEFVEEGGSGARSVVVLDDLPLVGLGMLDEVQDEVGMEGADWVEVFGAGFFVAAGGEEGFFQGGFEGFSR